MPRRGQAEVGLRSCALHGKAQNVSPVFSVPAMLFFTALSSGLPERHQFDAQALLVASSVCSLFPVSPPERRFAVGIFHGIYRSGNFAAFFVFQSEDQNVFQNFQKSAVVVCRRVPVVRSPCPGPGASTAPSQHRGSCLPDRNLTPGKVMPGWTLEMTEAKGGTRTVPRRTRETQT